MKLMVFSGLILVTSISVFSFSFRLNHLRAITLGLTKSTFSETITIEETSMTPRFIYQETNNTIDHYFLTNINPLIDYTLTKKFFDLDLNIEVSDDSANQVIVTIQAILLLTYEYKESVIISLIPNNG
jgi:hypothetical protein